MLSASSSPVIKSIIDLGDSLGSQPECVEDLDTLSRYIGQRSKFLVDRQVVPLVEVSTYFVAVEKVSVD